MKKLKRILCIGLAFMLVLATPLSVLAKDTVSTEGLVPVRKVFEEVGIQVKWDNKTKTANIGYDGILKFTANKKTAVYDGILLEMNNPPKMINGKLYAEAAFLKNFFGENTSETDLIIPNYAIESMTGEYKTKLDIYQQPVVGEENFLAALKPQTGWEFAKDLAEIGSSDFGFRTGGTPEGKEAAELVYKKFEELKLEPEYDMFKLYGWRYLDSSFTFDGENIPVVSAVGTKGTSDKGITGEVVYVGTASKQELKDVDLKGKIALIKMDLDVHPWQSQGAFAAANKGAIGVIYFCENYYGQYEGGEAFNVQDWSGAEISIPVLNTPKKYGEELVKKAQKGTYSATLVSEVEINENADGYNVIGQIKGGKYPDEYVIVNAHTDAYFQGFQDDAIAIGAMVSIAEAMQASNYTPDRTILFLSMDAEEFGAMDLGSDWLLGSWNMMKGKGAKWPGKVVGSLTIELFAYEETKNFEMRASDVLYEYVRNTINGFEYQAYEQAGIVKNEISNMSDEFSMAYYGIPTFRTNSDPVVTETIYHSQFDTEETTSYEKYKEAIGHYAKLLLRMDRMPVAPYDLTLGINKYNEKVDFEELNKLGMGSELDALAQQYEKNAKEIYFKNTLILKMYDKALAEGKNLSEINKNLAIYNQKVRDTIKTYATGTLAMEGDTVALEIPYYQGLPKLFDEAIIALEKKDGEGAVEILSELEGSYYADFEDYDTWYSVNRDNLDPDSPNRDTLWTENIRVQFLNHYEITQGLKEKIKKGETSDYSKEITACKEYKTIVLKNLKDAYNENIDVFKKANPQFPLKEADLLIEALR